MRTPYKGQLVLEPSDFHMMDEAKPEYPQGDAGILYIMHSDGFPGSDGVVHTGIHDNEWIFETGREKIHISKIRGWMYHPYFEEGEIDKEQKIAERLARVNLQIDKLSKGDSGIRTVVTKGGAGSYSIRLEGPSEKPVDDKRPS